MLTAAFSMLSLATKTHTSFGITLIHHKILKCICHDAGISNRHYFYVEFSGRIFQQKIGIRHTDGYLLCTVACRLVFILVWGGVCTKSPQSRKETPCTTIQFHLQIYKWCIVFKKLKICRVFRIYMSTCTWNKGNNGNFSRLLILGL